MGSEQLADLSGRRSNSGISGKCSVMPTTSPTAARESSMSSVFFFIVLFTDLFPFRDLGGKHRHHSAPSMEACYTLTLANHSHLCPHLPSTCIDPVPSNHVTDVNSSILCKQKTKKKKKHHHRLLFQLLPTNPTFSGSSRWRWWKTGSNWGRKQNRYKLTPATQSCIGRLVSRDTFETSAYLYACLPSETFAVSVALPALSHPRLMILVLCNLTVTVHHLSNARLFFSPFTCHNRRSYNYDDIVIVVSCCFYNRLCRKMDEWFTFVNKCEYIYGVPATFSAWH